MSIDAVIYRKLKSITAIDEALAGNILAEYRDDIVPALVCGVTQVDDVTEHYQGRDFTSYEVILTAVAGTIPEANAIADLVETNLDFISWTDGTTKVDLYFRDRQGALVRIAGDKKLSERDTYFEAITRKVS